MRAPPTIRTTSDTHRPTVALARFPGPRQSAHDLVVTEDAGQGRRGRPGQDAEHELAAAQVRADLAPDPVEHLGLDAEQDDVRAADGLDVALDGPDAVLALEGFAPFDAWMRGDDLLGRDQLAAEQPGDHRLGHDARPDDPDYADRAIDVCGLYLHHHGDNALL